MIHQGHKGFVGKNITWMIDQYLICLSLCFLAPGNFLLAAPSWGPTASPGSGPTPGILACWTVTPWVCQTLPTEAVEELKLRKGRQQALGPEASAETSEPNSGQAEPREALRSAVPAQSRAGGSARLWQKVIVTALQHYMWNSWNAYLFIFPRQFFHWSFSRISFTL